MKKYLTELIGTFFLVLVVGTSVIQAKGANPLAAIAIGLSLAVMVYAGGHISGAHYNPAVTLAVWLRGRCPTKDVGPYILFQIIGAALAALLSNYLRGQATPMSIDVTKSLFVELAFTFALAYVVLNTATAKGTANNSFYGAAIGLTVTAGAIAAGDISGGAFNPAVAIGGVMMGLFKAADLWVYLVACCAGGVAAAVAFKTLNPEDK